MNTQSGSDAVVRTPQNALKLTRPRAHASVLLAPVWEDPATWLPVLDAFIRTAADGATLYLDAGTTAVSAGNVRLYMLDAAWGDTNTGTATGGTCGAACAAYQVDHDAHWTATSPE